MADDLLRLYRDQNATTYERRRSESPKWRFETDSLSRVLFENRPQIYRIIDAPVGTGRFLDVYAQVRDDIVVYGFDRSADMMDIARQRPGARHVEFRSHDIIAEPFGVHADVAVCFRFLNLVPWKDASSTLGHLFAAADKFVVIAIRTVRDDYRGERVIDGKIHLHERSALERLCHEHRVRIVQVSQFDTDRAGDYSVMMCATARPMRASRVNKNSRLAYAYGSHENDGKVYEVKDETHARFIQTVTNDSGVSHCFPRTIRTDGAFVDAEWIPGELLPSTAWHRALELLVRVQALHCEHDSSFDYVEDLVIPRFRKAVAMLGQGLCDYIVSTIRARSASYAVRMSHPDVIPGNVIVTGRDDLKLIDNELLCRSRHYRIDILNLLHNLERAQRAPILASYLRLTGESLDAWEEQRDYLTCLWCARQVGSALLSNKLERVRQHVEAFEQHHDVLPYELTHVQSLC